MSNRQYLNGGDYYGNLGLYFPQYLGNTFISIFKPRNLLTQSTVSPWEDWALSIFANQTKAEHMQSRWILGADLQRKLNDMRASHGKLMAEPSGEFCSLQLPRSDYFLLQSLPNSALGRHLPWKLNEDGSNWKSDFIFILRSVTIY